MILKTLLPAYPLSDYVALLTYYKGYIPQHTIEKLLPDGSVNIIIELDEIKRYTFDGENLKPKTKCVKAWVSGMQEEAIYFSAEKYSCMFVIQFKAGGGFPFLHIPLEELNNLIIDAELVFGDEILFLREKLLEKKSHLDMFTEVENWLMKRAKKSILPQSIVDFATTNIQKNPTLNSIKTIAQRSGYSKKQFIQIFKKHVGLTPKSYQRVVRFNMVLHEIEKYSKIDWLKISLDCGYYDQAHFINEFKIFSGINPTEYLLLRGEYLNYLPIFEKR